MSWPLACCSASITAFRSSRSHARPRVALDANLRYRRGGPDGHRSGEKDHCEVYIAPGERAGVALVDRGDGEYLAERAGCHNKARRRCCWPTRARRRRSTSAPGRTRPRPASRSPQGWCRRSRVLAYPSGGRGAEDTHRHCSVITSHNHAPPRLLAPRPHLAVTDRLYTRHQNPARTPRMSALAVSRIRPP